MLIVAAMAMIIETSWSHAPPRRDVRLEAKQYQEQNVVVRFHTTDGITYVTSSYAVTDSSIVVRNILRETKYYAPTEAELYNQLLTPAPEDILLPAELPITRIKSMDQWQPRSAGRDVGEGMLVIVGIVAVAIIVVLHNVRLGAD
jgi:hypothetical protein